MPRARLRIAPSLLALALHAVAAPALAQSKPPAKPSPGTAAAPAPASAPSAPQDLVARGQALFDDQQYEESIQTLSAALLRPSNTKAQKIEIYRLLALNYITLNRKDEAESAVRGLLAIDPEYRMPASESPRFRDFFASVQKRWEAEGRPGVVKEAAPPPATVTMRHFVPAQVDEGARIDLTASIDDPQARVVEVKLFYRSGTKGKFEEASAALEDGTLRASIPGSAVHGALVEYYLQGVDASGLPVVTRGDAGTPLRVPVNEPSKSWILPVAIGGGVLGAVAIVGGLALAGVFKGSGGGGQVAAGGNARVDVTVGEAWHR